MLRDGGFKLLKQEARLKILFTNSTENNYIHILVYKL